MTQTQTQTPMSMKELQEVSELMRGADWALAHNDLGTLGAVATQLVDHIAAPLRHDLLTIVDLSRRDPDVAIELWVTTRTSLHDYLCEHAAAPPG